MLTQQFHDAAAAMLAEHDYPGLSYALVRSGGLVLAGAVGVTDRTTNTPATPPPVYQVASVSKMLAGALAARLAAEHRLDLDAPLSRYWADPNHVAQGPNGAQISIRMLLSQTAGMPRYPANLQREN